MLFVILLYLIITLIGYRIYQHFHEGAKVSPKDKFVLISGCDTGFGRHLAIELDKQGFNVVATVYNKSSIENLSKILSANAHVLELDITKSEHIKTVHQYVSSKTDSLYALVNNAGIDQDGLIDWISVGFMRSMMEINFYGHVEMTKRFLALLTKTKGSRVINLCSVAGYLTAPAMSSYCASKYALEAFSDCLRREMRPWSLFVSIIEPSYMKTPIIEGHVDTMQQIWDNLSPEKQERWGENYLKNLMYKRSNNLFIKLAQDPMVVVRDLEHAVTSEKPRIRYRPGWQSSFFFFPLSMLPSSICDFLMANVRGENVTPAGVEKQLDS